MVVVRAAVTILALRDALLVWENAKLDVVMVVLGLVSLTVQVILNIQHTSNNSLLEVAPDTKECLIWFYSPYYVYT